MFRISNTGKDPLASNRCTVYMLEGVYQNAFGLFVGSISQKQHVAIRYMGGRSKRRLKRDDSPRRAQAKVPQPRLPDEASRLRRRSKIKVFSKHCR
jgi:hypothetical protein